MANPLVGHGRDVFWAMVFAAVFALALDLLNPDSGTRRGLRHINNKLSEQSVRSLRNRIVQLERYREKLASDRGLYLLVFQLIVLMLMLLIIALSLEIVRHAGIAVSRWMIGPMNLDAQSLVVLLAAWVTGMQAMKHAAMDTKAKVLRTLAGLDAEIADLRKKLLARS